MEAAGAAEEEEVLIPNFITIQCCCFLYVIFNIFFVFNFVSHFSPKIISFNIITLLNRRQIL